MPSTPPLPETLSTRLLSSIDPRTGACRHHPQVKLCELVQNNSRWVVRRKICYKCGSRQGNGKFHRPGVAVKSGGDRGRDGERRGSESLLRRSESVGSSRARERSVSRERSRGTHLPSSRARSVSRERSGHSRADVRDSAAVSKHAASFHADDRASRRESRKRDGFARAEDVYDKTARGAAAPTPSASERRGSSFRAHAPSTALVATPAPATPAPATPAPPQEEDFDESDPIIYIPALSPDEELPPPPPRTDEEMERHVERLEMRRAHDKTAEKKSREPPQSYAHGKKEEHGMPSATALALLESHGREVQAEGDYRKSEQRRRSTERKKERAHHKPAKSHKREGDEASETSSISTASAKFYQLEPENALYAKHPELEGVVPTSFAKEPEAFPPKEIRARSVSRGRKKIDPDEDRAPAVVCDPPPEKKKEPHRSKSFAHPEKEKRREGDERKRHSHAHSRHAATPVPEDLRVRSRSKSVRGERRRSSSRRRSQSHHDKERARSPVVSSVPHSEIKTLANSAARMSRHRDGGVSGSKSVGHHLSRRSRDKEPSPPRPSSKSVAEPSSHHKADRSTCRSMARSTARSRRSASRSKRQNILDEASECCSILKDLPSKPGKRHTSGGTTSTQPLSVSSDEICGKREIKSETTAAEEQPAVLYKKRARRRDDPTEGNSIPVAHITTDEKSHASSISSSSTIEESFAYSDKAEEGGEGGNDKSRKSGYASRHAQAVNVLKDVKGGAVGLASRGKSALGGLKGTSKKWQSALFM